MSLKKKTIKTLTCKQLGGACDKEFAAEMFKEMAELSKQHGMEMHAKGDEAHLAAIKEMKEMMENDPKAAQEWFAKKEEEFNALPDEE